MENKLVPGILIGAVIGGAAALASKVSKIKDEVLYWKDVVEEIRRNNPELERSLKDAKETFVNRKNQR